MILEYNSAELNIFVAEFCLWQDVYSRYWYIYCIVLKYTTTHGCRLLDTKVDHYRKKRSLKYTIDTLKSARVASQLLVSYFHLLLSSVRLAMIMLMLKVVNVISATCSVKTIRNWRCLRGMYIRLTCLRVLCAQILLLFHTSLSLIASGL